MIVENWFEVLDSYTVVIEEVDDVLPLQPSSMPPL